MACLRKLNADGRTEILELKLGVNVLGRDAESHIPVNHASVSARHCELILTAAGVLVHDLDSTNGTFVDNVPVRQAVLQPGQNLRLGSVEFVVEDVSIKIAIPAIERPVPAPPVVLPDGVMLCQRHPHARVTHRCPHCHAVLCDHCVTRLRRRGGKTLKLCKLCSHPVTSLHSPSSRAKSFWSRLRLAATHKLPFLHGGNNK
ncbi:MAG TPA: FHA domain-containing protein [Verrucomicrobiota bacterium]|nr:FHA domain-containing protein [Verrucomicrobiota bacterium]HNT14712.1 FHA domain-containing protein [Verrucomicrobiota bacterium]